MTELFLSAWLLVSFGFERPLYTPELGLDEDDEPARVDEFADLPTRTTQSVPGAREIGWSVSADAHRRAHSKVVRSLFPSIARCHHEGLKRHPDDPAVIDRLSMTIFVDARGRARVFTTDGTYDAPLRACVYRAIEHADFPRSAATIHYSVQLDEL